MEQVLQESAEQAVQALPPTGAMLPSSALLREVKSETTRSAPA
jgi:hypothetical protein